MASYDIDKLIEQSFSGDPPGSAFRARVLKDSMEAFSRGRRAHVRRRLVQFGLAAAFIASVSFFTGRHLAPRSVTARPEPVAAESTETVMVSRELVAWLEAARFFKELGMEERMARALERAGKLRTYHNASADDPVDGRFAATDGRAVEEVGNPAGLEVLPRLYEPTRSTEGIMATSFGGYSYASEND